MKEFLTFKSGKFYFNEQYDHAKVSDLLIRAIVLNETIVDLPILPALSSRLEPVIMYSSISGTAAIEGNPITEEDVRKIAEGQDIETYSKKDKQEILNLIEAYNLLSDYEADINFTLKELSIVPPFSLLYRDVSTQTARRDLAKLSRLNLLTHDGGGKYHLNHRALG